MNATRDKKTTGNLFDRDTLLHLRIPFSFYLLPVFWFGLSQAPAIHLVNTVIVFIALHFFIYPGSNIYNSYMDNDTGSIGGLEHPPPVTRKLYYASMVCDAAGLLLCSLTGLQNVLIMAGYVGFSKSYSWHGIRLKKYTYLSWASVMFFQGGYTCLLAGMAAGNGPLLHWLTMKNAECMLFASLIIGGSYPLTQIYQHAEDGGRGDYTISYRLGIMGTFIFAAIFFVAGGLVALHYFTRYYSLQQFFIFLTCLSPVLIYFTYWLGKARKNRALADYRHAMLMNKISSVCMVICFTVILIINRPRLF